MKHRVVGRKLGRTSAHRLALLRNMSASLFENERITTTLMKAKELRPFAERLVTLSKRETLHARRQILRHITDNLVVTKLFDTISARFAQRPGGYTRIIKLGPRRGDNAEMAIIELVGNENGRKTETPAPKDRAKKTGGRRATEAEAEAGAEPAPEKSDRKSGKKSARKGRAGKKAAAGAKAEEAKKPRASRKRGAGGSEVGASATKGTKGNKKTGASRKTGRSSSGGSSRSK